MNRILLGTVALVTVTACVYTTASLDTANAQSTGVSTELEGVNRLSTSAGIDVVYEVSDVYTIDIEVTRGDIEDVRVERDGDTLEIGRVRRDGWGWNDRLNAIVTVLGPNLVEVDASSGSDATVKGLRAADFSAEASSGADLDLEGTCETLRADASSGSDIDARALRCEDGWLEASSGADIDAYLTGTVDIDVSSGADASVEGGARIGSAEKSSGADYSVKPGPL
ncbi:MAG: DUF2807 domain-containing protein [Pseudomonadota bacterium]